MVFAFVITKHTTACKVGAECVIYTDWFPKKVRDEVVAARRAEPHHILLRQPSDVDRAIELLHLSYEIATQAYRSISK